MYRAHRAWMPEHDLAGLFGAGGTGGFFSLSQSELVRMFGAALCAA